MTPGAKFHGKCGIDLEMTLLDCSRIIRDHRWPTLGKSDGAQQEHYCRQKDFTSYQLHLRSPAIGKLLAAAELPQRKYTGYDATSQSRQVSRQNVVILGNHDGLQ
jgi:hypothetical protein